MATKNPIVIVMTKVPGASDVKTRLRPVLNSAGCTSLAICFLGDTVANITDNFENVIIAFTPEDGKKELTEILGNNHRMIAQKGRDLGERLSAVIAGAFDSGFGPVLVIGTDSPTLPPEYLARAFAHLQTHDNGVSIGPTGDGGYYLIGVSKPHKTIFEDIRWSSDKVFAQTIAKIKMVGDVDLQILPKWYDVDNTEDLLRLRSELLSDDTARKLASRTNLWFEDDQIAFDSISDADRPFLMTSG